MWTIARLASRRVRSEIAICFGASIALMGATLMLAFQITASRNTDAFAGWISLASFDLTALVLVPVVVGLAVGTSLIGAEFDRATTVFAWSVSPSRRRWLFEAIVVGAVATLLVSTPMAVATEFLTDSIGSLSISSSLSVAEPSAILLPCRSVAALGIAVVVAIMTRRSLATFVMAMLVSCLLLGSLELAFSAWREAAAIPLDSATPGMYFVANRIVSHSGENYLTFVPVGLEPAARIGILAAQGAATLASGMVALVLAVVVVEKRRPV